MFNFKKKFRVAIRECRGGTGTFLDVRVSYGFRSKQEYVHVEPLDSDYGERLEDTVKKLKEAIKFDLGLILRETSYD